MLTKILNALPYLNQALGNPLGSLGDTQAINPTCLSIHNPATLFKHQQNLYALALSGMIWYLALKYQSRFKSI